MDDTTARANLLIARHVEVKDPNGKLWTVHVVRPGEPRSPGLRLSNMYGVAIAINRLGRLLRRDRSWDVELMAGAFGEDRRDSVVQSTEANKDDAIDAAIRLALQVQADDVRG